MMKHKISKSNLGYKCTLISIVNNREIYSEFRQNLNEQVGINYLFIPCMNIHNEFSSARDAFNSVIDKIKGDYAVFLHPDIRFLNEEALQRIILICDSINKFGVIGVAGCPKELEKGRRVIYSSIIHGQQKVMAGRKIEIPLKIQTVDECLFIMKTDLIKEIGFTKLQGWHLYAVEQCLRAENMGLSNYVIPADLWHLSDGKSLDSSYVKQIDQIIEYYGNNTDYINTTVKSWKTKGTIARMYRHYYYYKQRIKKIVMEKIN